MNFHGRDIKVKNVPRQNLRAHEIQAWYIYRRGEAVGVGMVVKVNMGHLRRAWVAYCMDNVTISCESMREAVDEVLVRADSINWRTA